MSDRSCDKSQINLLTTLTIHYAICIELAVDVWPEDTRDPGVGEEVGIHCQQLRNVIWERVVSLCMDTTGYLAACSSSVWNQFLACNLHYDVASDLQVH